MSFDHRPPPPPQPQSSINWLVVILLILASAMLWRFKEGGLAGGSSNLLDPNAKPRPITARGDLAEDEKSTIALFRAASISVVHITSLKRSAQLHLDATDIPQGTGSGFVWDEDGNIVTNFHVIKGAEGAKVTLQDHSTWDARLVGFDQDKDIAVLKIKVPGGRLKPIMIGTSKDLAVGQKVFAIGNPFGLDQTLTTGIISGLGREIQSTPGTTIEGVIQIDAAINPGNSGGPLLDSAGRLIGVNTAIYSPSGTSAGVGFAVPVDIVNIIVPQIIAHGKAERVGLGITTWEDQATAKLRLTGVLVMQVRPNSPAEKAGIIPTQDTDEGIKLGDLIVAIDELPVKSTADLYKILQKHKAGDTVTVTVQRAGKFQELPVTLQVLQ